MKVNSTWVFYTMANGATILLRASRPHYSRAGPGALHLWWCGDCLGLGLLRWLCAARREFFPCRLVGVVVFFSQEIMN